MEKTTAEKVLTFEKVDQHVNRNHPKLAGLGKQGPKSAGPRDAKLDAAKLKQIYVIARPVLSLVAGLFIIPKKWRDVINTLMLALDAITGQTPA